MKLLSALVGNAINRQLADPKLEALRRMAVLTWHQSYAVPKGELTAFFDAGYSPDHYELLGKRVAEAHVARSEEHTSELQSLMRISYAVFCLKKKKSVKQPTTQQPAST